MNDRSINRGFIKQKLDLVNFIINLEVVEIEDIYFHPPWMYHLDVVDFS